MTPAAFRFAVTSEFRRFRVECLDLGFVCGLQLLAARYFGSTRVQRLVIPGFRLPVFYRPQSSDVLVLRQVLGRGEYECVGREPTVRTILDLGGNSGYAAFALLHRYPKAGLVFVEPDSENFAVARKTLAPFRDRVAFVQSGVWDASVPLVVERGARRDGGNWAFQVRPTQEGESTELFAVTIDDLLKRQGWAGVDLVKMDIEGAEAIVFRGASVHVWLPLVRTLAVELHGPDCDAALTSAYAAIRHARSRHGETTVIRVDPETRR